MGEVVSRIVVLLDGRPTPFDLIHHGRQDLAYRQLNGYIERTGDYGGLRLLPFYTGMRALVRIRVILERLRQRVPDDDPVGQSRACERLQALAEHHFTARQDRLTVMYGVSGSDGMVRVRSDAERPAPAAPCRGAALCRGDDAAYLPAAAGGMQGRLCRGVPDECGQLLILEPLDKEESLFAVSATALAEQ